MMYLHDALPLLTATTAVVNLTSTELLMLAFPDGDAGSAIEMTRVDLISAAVREAFDYPDFQRDLATVLAEIAAYAAEQGFAEDGWEQLAV